MFSSHQRQWRCGAMGRNEEWAGVARAGDRSRSAVVAVTETTFTKPSYDVYSSLHR